MSRECATITGSSKGLGESLAIVFSQNNYDIILHGRNESDLEKVKRKAIGNNVDCYVVRGEITLEETIEKLAEKSIEKDISVLINNAAVGFEKSFDNLGFEEIESVLRTNLISPIKLARKIYPLFLEKKQGVIININGGDGLRGRKLGSIYCASKYGLKGFSDALRLEAKENNIKVLGVHLSGMKTDMYGRNRKDFEKCMEPLEVAQVIFDLAKNYSSLSADEVSIGRMRY